MPNSEEPPINQLTGPALDAAVAREVMGWRLRIEPVDDISSNRLWETGNGGTRTIAEWQPHADCNDLHRVIARMEDRGFLWKISKYTRGIVAVFGRGIFEWHDDSFHDNINTAVLRACLLAVRSEK